MVRRFITSDSHFNHDKIIEYCNRPFRDVETMNQELIRRWNSVVGENDLVYHLGDFAFNMSFEELKTLVERLNGNIVLVKGNHDRKSIQYYRRCGFVEVFEWQLVLDNCILTHRPMKLTDLPREMINIHGHLHNYEDSVGDEYINVCVENTEYEPIELDKLFSII